MLEGKFPDVFWLIQLMLNLTVEVRSFVNFSYSFTKGIKNIDTGTSSSLQRGVLLFISLSPKLGNQ